MSVPNDSRDGASTTSLATSIGASIAALVASRVLTSHRDPKTTLQWGEAVPVALACGSFAWMSVVSSIVTEPYLDEVFHVPQAQTYCRGQLDWDDKITTPPGLYFTSLILAYTAKALGLGSTVVCDARSLRAFNVFAVSFLGYLAFICRQRIEANLSQGKGHAPTPSHSAYAAHTALNIGLFPLLFFFSGLYYTDVLSTAAVLGAYANHLSRVASERRSLISDGLTIVLGLLALLMRQTNIFWVAIYMGGLEAVHAVKTIRAPSVERRAPRSIVDSVEYFVADSSRGAVLDVPLSQAWPQDYCLATLSLLVAALCNLPRVLRQIYPYIVILLSFAGFVVWNGGVVLGDKSNHVATIHLAQMLYIWPLFTFFSAPLFLPYVVSVGCAATKAVGISASYPSSPATTASNRRYFTANRLIWTLWLLATTAFSVAVVKFNTIIHPFTLADNRHYMFYIFRYTIRRGSWIRYGLVPVYTASRLLIWGAMSGYYDPLDKLIGPGTDRAVQRQQSNAEKRQSKVGQLTSGPGHKASEPAADLSASSTGSVPTSTGLIFLLATALSLVTAPLVEPRYFILPWVVWRLQVPAWQPPAGLLGSKLGMCRALDVRLTIETLWFVLINAFTGYIFLYKPYQWRAEDGTLLDQGRLQRFMW